MSDSSVTARPVNLLCRAIVAAVAVASSAWLCSASHGEVVKSGSPSAKESQPDGATVFFESDIQPLLTRFGCNSGPCHGKSRGQNGFALSLLGYDSDFDYSAIVLDSRGRRLQFSAPDNSLLLRKAAGLDSHVGGVRFEPNSPHYELIRQWIVAGSPRAPADAPQLVGVRLEPKSLSLSAGEAASVRVLAEYSGGGVRDVTDAAAFESNDRGVAEILENGVLKAGELPGETAVMARYLNHISVCSVTIPLKSNITTDQYLAVSRSSPIDELVLDKVELLGILPSPATSQSGLLRRTYLRIIGRLPTSDESRQFLNDPRPLNEKRATLVDQLLERPEYADYWANKWADLLRPNPYRAGMKAVFMLDSWLRQAFRGNMPYDQMVTELVTAQGSTWTNGATVLFRDRPQTVEIASSVSQLFLGIRLECAKCHHHPFEVWSQDDFFGFAAFFSRVGHKGEGLSPPISGGEEMIFNAESGTLRHERTGEIVQPKTLTGESLELGPEDDPRQILAAWMTTSTNPYFPRVMANRIWAELMGLGLVDPVDDIRATNPASNEALLDYLSEEFRRQAYDIKQLIRTIALSETFARSSVPNETNSSDNRNFSRYYRQRIRAEVLLDAVNDILGTEESLAAMPPGSRTIQMWTHRTPSTFLDTFGRPDANLDPPYERSNVLTTPQMLHLMNSEDLEKKLSKEDGRIAKLAASDLSNEAVIEELYLWLYSRRPSTDETTTALAVLSISPPDARQSALQDITWALLNTPEFYFID
jgi:hypothetical protein